MLSGIVLLTRHHCFLVQHLCKNIMDKMEMTTARDKGQGAKLWWKVSKDPQHRSMGKIHDPYSFYKDVQTLQSAVHGLHHFEWLTDWLANESLNQVSDWHLSVYCKIYAQGRYPWNSSYQWRFYIHLTIFVFLRLHEGHSYHGSADDQVEVKVHVTTHTICSAGRVTQWQHVREPGIHLHGNQFRSPE